MLTDGRTDGRTTDGRTTDAGVTGILIAHLGAFGSGELKISVSGVAGLKILGRVGTLFFFLEKMISCILKGSLPFKMH